MLAIFPDPPLLIIAFSPVGTRPPLQLVAVFQSVLVPPVQSAALAAERPKEMTMAVTRGAPMLELRRPGVWFLGFMVFSGMDLFRVEVAMVWGAALGLKHGPEFPGMAIVRND
jgi:hypothetical protein